MTLPPVYPILLPGALVALAVSLLLLAMERRSDPGTPVLGGAIAMLVLAALIVLPGGTARPPLVAALAAAALAHDRRDRFHSECALKLLWVMGPALALSWLGAELLVITTGTRDPIEQWGVLAIGLEPRFLWNVALPLSLVAGLVFLGGPPFHFWLADLIQGGRPWLASLAVAAIQSAGAWWLVLRLHGIEGFADGAEITGDILRIAAEVALIAGAATLPFQRRPERRAGTLASLQGALLLAGLSAVHARPGFESATLSLVARWSVHLALALTGAALLARFLPMSEDKPVPETPLFRRHRLAAILGGYAWLSLSGVPGTPGSLLWLDVARTLSASGHNGLLIALAIAWLVSLAVAIQQVRDAIGVPLHGIVPPKAPWAPRVALAATGLSLAALAARWWRS
jgi:NADH:ubiquinone oxidoreductase subunit 2 (subunit N)